MKISHTTDIIRDTYDNHARIAVEIDSFKIEFSILLDYIEVLNVFNENLKLMIEEYGNLHERFSRTFWTGTYNDYSFELYSDSYMTIEVKGKTQSKFSLKITELEDLKQMYKCLVEIYELMDKEYIPDRYKMEFQ